MTLESHNCRLHLDELESVRIRANQLQDENRTLKATNVINKMLENKLKSYESKIGELEMTSKSNNCQSQLSEIEILKVRIQT